MLEIRPFQPADQTAARALILAGLAAHWGWLDPSLNPDLDDIAASYAGGVFLVAVNDGRLVGTGALLPEAAGVGRIVRMSVSAAERRRGIGRAVLRALIAAAAARGYTRIVLETTTTWADAIAFYEANGFRRTHEAEGDIHFVREILLHNGNEQDTD